MLKIKKVFALFCFLPLFINAQGVSDALRLAETQLGSGARALGMGNSYIGVSDDFSALVYNPAGLGLIKRFELSTGVEYNSFSNSTSFMNSNTKFDKTKTNLSQIGFVYPLPTVQGSLVFAAGYSQIANFNKVIKYDGYNSGNTSMIQDLTSKNDDITYDLGLSYAVFSGSTWLNDETLIKGRLNQSAEIIQSGSINQYSLGGAMEVAKNLFVGLTFNAQSGTFKQTKDYYEDDIYDVYGASFETSPGEASTKDFETFNLFDQIDWDLSGYNFQFGMMYMLENRSRIGINVKLPTVYTIKEKYFVDSYAVFGNSKVYIPEAMESKIEYDITTPFEFGVGVSVPIIKNMLLSGQFNFIDYSQTEYSSGLDATSKAANNRNIANDLKGVINVNIGAEYSFIPQNLRVRGGFIYMPTAYNADNESKFDKKYFTLGLGYLIEQMVAIDVAYIHGWWSDYGDSYTTGGSRYEQEINYNNILCTVSYRF